MDYLKEAEISFEKELKKYHSRGRKKQSTGVKCVLKYMLESDKTWIWSWEFVGKTTRDGSYLSHRAPARASDLAIFHPELVEGRKIGRFSIYRLRLENKDKIIKFLNGK